VKAKFCEAPIVAYWDPTLETYLEADASGTALGGVLLQEKDGVRRPVGFFSKKLNKAEINYDIHDKEMLAIIECLKF